MSEIEAEFTINLTVWDRGQLRFAAEQRAIMDGLTAEEYAEMRRDHPSGPIACDLIMLLDPGSLPGCDIEQSVASSDADDDDDACRTCGGPGASGDDAYDGECPSCADRSHGDGE